MITITYTIGNTGSVRMITFDQVADAALCVDTVRTFDCLDLVKITAVTPAYMGALALACKPA